MALIKDEASNTNVTFFLRQDDNFELHIFEASGPNGTGSQNLENQFSPELMDSICQANRACTLDDMLTMGLQTNPSELAKLSAVTLPLGTLGSSQGFILLYRSSQNKLQLARLANLAAIRYGLSRAIASCQQLTHPAE